MLKTLIIYIILPFPCLFGSVEENVSQIQDLLDEKKYSDAFTQFEQGLMKYDASAALYFIGGQISIKLDNLDDGNKYFIKAIELDPKNEDYRATQQRLEELKNSLKIARKSFESGLIDDSIIEYEKLTVSFSDHAIVFYNLGRVYKANEEYDSAVQNYQKARELNPFEEKYSKAVTAIAQEMAKNGDTEYRRQEFDTAIENYKKAIHYSPTYTTALFKLARTYYKLKDYENARLTLEQNLTVDPQQEQSEKMLGDIHRGLGNSDYAMEHYNKAIAINSNYYKAYYSLGTILISLGKQLEARDALNTAVLLEPTYAKAFGTLGIVEQELGNINPAIENYTKAIEFDPTAFDIHYRLASALNFSNQHENAKQSAKNCLNIKRNYAPAFFELGIAEKAMGNNVAAKDAFEKAKKDRNWRKSAQFELELISKGL